MEYSVRMFECILLEFKEKSVEFMDKFLELMIRMILYILEV